MTAPLRVVQVGAGAMGRGWLGTIEANPDVELVGLVDLDLDVARQAAADHGHPDLEVDRSVSAVAARTGAEAVVNVTVPAAHRPTSVEALRAGLPVLCEKPIAASVAEALSMIAAAESSGRLLMISQSRRYYRALTALRRQLGRLGPLGLVECSFLKAPHFGGFREEMDHPLLVDMAIHQFDLARDLVGADPVSVTCDAFNPPWSWFRGDAAARVGFVFANGCRFSYTGSWVSGGVETSWNGDWRFSAADGGAAWDGDDLPVARTVDGAAIEEDADDVPQEIAGSLVEFVRAVRTGAEPSGEAHRNVVSLAMVEAAVRASETGGAVAIADVLADAHRSALATETDPELLAVIRSWDDIGAVVRPPAPQLAG
ncbi:putative dehydrogenase [Friedmanniella endophytica]|uniref:Putative dehydrogenase n=1 Tax=Microlunatus kandeliicorticis TaxID=1759536 RepID=A0A7W3IRE0_9ACTN|nr:Gfo/Idh/MocA family oxidoreductase [Microlunatus kandeliicorticis]MBA8793853.1 putative dehydrogenase [Microlunatus kandeliicorticis]